MSAGADCVRPVMLAYMAADCSSTGALGEDNAFALGKRLRWKEDIYCI